jgi:hypothetical protein
MMMAALYGNVLNLKKKILREKAAVLIVILAVIPEETQEVVLAAVTKILGMAKEKARINKQFHYSFLIRRIYI